MSEELWRRDLPAELQDRTERFGRKFAWTLLRNLIVTYLPNEAEKRDFEIFKGAWHSRSALKTIWGREVWFSEHCSSFTMGFPIQNCRWVCKPESSFMTSDTILMKIYENGTVLVVETLNQVINFVYVIVLLKKGFFSAFWSYTNQKGSYTHLKHLVSINSVF